MLRISRTITHTPKPRRGFQKVGVGKDEIVSFVNLLNNSLGMSCAMISCLWHRPSNFRSIHLRLLLWLCIVGMVFKLVLCSNLCPSRTTFVVLVSVLFPLFLWLGHLSASSWERCLLCCCLLALLLVWLSWCFCWLLLASVGVFVLSSLVFCGRNSLRVAFAFSKSMLMFYEGEERRKTKTIHMEAMFQRK
jgi:hypothetical protein